MQSWETYPTLVGVSEDGLTLLEFAEDDGAVLLNSSGATEIILWRGINDDVTGILQIILPVRQRFLHLDFSFEALHLLKFGCAVVPVGRYPVFEGGIASFVDLDATAPMTKLLRKVRRFYVTIRIFVEVLINRSQPPRCITLIVIVIIKLIVVPSVLRPISLVRYYL